MRTAKLSILMLFLVLTQLVYSQNYTLAVEANYPQEQAVLVYQPLEEWLEKQTGLTIDIVTSDNYYFYWRSARDNEPDFTLDASHIAAYRMQEKNYVPLARFQEDISYHLISNIEPTEGQSIDEFLVGDGVVTLPNPNMGSILFDQWFTDLFLQPNKVVTALSWGDVLEQVFAQSANAAIVPSYVFELYPNLLSLKESDKVPGMTFLSSPTVDPGIRKIVQDALMAIGTNDDSFDILIELNSKGFKEVDQAAYDGLADLLTKMMY